MLGARTDPQTSLGLEGYGRQDTLEKSDSRILKPSPAEGEVVLKGSDQNRLVRANLSTGQSAVFRRRQRWTAFRHSIEIDGCLNT